MRAPSPLLIAGFGVFCGCMVDALIKGLSAELAIVTITLWRFLFGSVYALSAYVLARRGLPQWPAIRFHAMRGSVSVVSALCFFWALTQLGLAEATVLGFTAALMIAPIARVILGEAITTVSVLAALAGFAGAAFALSGGTTGAPEDGNRLLGAVSTLVAAFTYALSIVLVRLRTREEDSLTIVMFSNVMPALILGGALVVIVVSPWWPSLDLMPAPRQLPTLAMIGFFGLSIWWMFTLAYARAPAQRLAPLEYTALIWSGLLGYAFFQEVPNWQLYVGAVIIIGACLLVAFDSHFASRRETRAPSSDLLE